MSEFLKTAMGYFNTNGVSQTSHYPPSNTSSNGVLGGGHEVPGDNVQHSHKSNTSWLSNEELCGHLVHLPGIKLRVKETLAIGGFAYVFRVEDVHSHKEYALKRLISVDKEISEAIELEISIHRQLNNHTHIVDLISFESSEFNIGGEIRTEHLLLMELCSGGSLAEYLNEAPLEPSEILKVFYQAVTAVAHMHSQRPPISHRDIKIENFLIDENRQLKLCDFGSASKDVYNPTFDWNAKEHNLLEEKLCVVTTPMYRAPEMLDTWSNHEISSKVDIWALGCVLYMLCFQKHPFEDSGKLRIINGNYSLPADSHYHWFYQIIKGCLIVDPVERFNCSTILEHLAAISETMKMPLRGQILLKKRSQSQAANQRHRSHSKDLQSQSVQNNWTENGSGNDGVVSPEMGRSVFYDKSSISSTTSNEAAGGSSFVNGTNLLSSLRGGAGNFLKNLKDTSSKVMQTVQQTIGRSDIDISYITTRVLVMPTPSEGLESTYKSNNIEDVRNYIESHFAPHKVSVYNFGPKNVPRLPPPIRTVDASTAWTSANAHAPILSNVYALAEDMYGFLNADSKSVVIIQSPIGGCCTSAFFVCALLMYADLTTQPEDAVQVFAVKRYPINLRASEFRYLYYLGDLLRTPPLNPHFKNVQLLSLSCEPVPRMTKARDGCRLYVEVYVNDYFVLSTLPDSYEKIPLHLAGPGTVTIPLHVNVCGDLLIILYHARKAMVRPHGVKICQFQMHTGFVPEQETLITLSVPDLDDIPDSDCVPSNFKVSLSLAVREATTPPARNPPWLVGRPPNGAHHLFSSSLEHQEMTDNFVTKLNAECTQNRPNANGASSSSSSSSSSVSSASPSSTTYGERPQPKPRRRGRPSPPIDLGGNPSTQPQQPPQPPQPSSPPMPPSPPREEPLLNVGGREEEEEQVNGARGNDIPLIMPDITSFQPEVLMVPSDIPARIDLLNLHHRCETTSNPSGGDASFDLLGVFTDDNIIPHSSNMTGSNGPIPDILSSNTQPETFQSSANLDDILGPLDFNYTEPSSMNALNPNVFSAPPTPMVSNSVSNNNTTSKFRITSGLTTSSSMDQEQRSNDPFADLANLASGQMKFNNVGNNLAGGSCSNVPINPIKITPPPRRGADRRTEECATTSTASNVNSNSRFMGGIQSPTTSANSRYAGATGTSHATGGGAKSNGGIGTRPMADYNRSHFVNMTTNTSNNNASGNSSGSNAAAASGSTDVFADILGQQGYKFSQKANQSPRSINDMRKVERMKDMDPNQILIMEWTDGKKNNIRSLLCTLHEVLWPNAKWVKCEMSQIISPADVKKFYRKACLAVHPDKNTGTENEEVAKMIFMELNYAWNEFEKDATQQSVFM